MAGLNHKTVVDTHSVWAACPSLLPWGMRNSMRGMYMNLYIDVCMHAFSCLPTFRFRLRREGLAVARSLVEVLATTGPA